jgi:VanZ family protein
VVRWLIWGGFVVVWTTLLLLPGSDFAKMGFDLGLNDWKIFAAKVAHLLAYALFAFLSGVLRVPARFRWMPLYFAMAHGALTELLQQHVEGRHGCLEDVALNYAGILLGLVVGWKWWCDPK